MADEIRASTAAGGQGVREQLIREIDEARARLAALEGKLAREGGAPGRRAVAGIPSIDLERFEVDPAFIEIIPAETARKHRVLPLCVSRVFTIAVADPSNQAAIDEISARTGFLVQPVLATEAALAEALDHYYGPPGSTGGTGRPRAHGSLRLVWSGGDSPRREPGGGPDGGRPAA